MLSEAEHLVALASYEQIVIQLENKQICLIFKMCLH